MRERWVYLPNSLLLSGIGASELAVFAMFAAYGDRDICIPIRRIARATRLSTATVAKALNRLVERKLVSRYRGWNAQDAKRYRVLVRADGKNFFSVPYEAIGWGSGKKLLVYAYLSKCANEYGVCYPSERQIAAALHLSRTTVRKYTALLEREKALLRAHRWYKKTRPTRARRSFTYFLKCNTAPTRRTRRRPHGRARRFSFAPLVANRAALLRCPVALRAPPIGGGTNFNTHSKPTKDTLKDKKEMLMKLKVLTKLCARAKKVKEAGRRLAFFQKRNC